MSHSRAFLDSLRVGTPVEFFIEASSAWVCGTVAGKRRGTRGPYSYIDVDIRPHRDAPVAIRVFDDDTDEAVSVLLVPRGTFLSSPSPRTRSAPLHSLPPQPSVAPTRHASAATMPPAAPLPTEPEEQPLLILSEDLAKGFFVDVLDLYTGKQTGGRMQKWEPCCILDTRPDAIFVRFVKWSAANNAWIPQAEWPFRLAPYESHSISAKPIPEVFPRVITCTFIPVASPASSRAGSAALFSPASHSMSREARPVISSATVSPHAPAPAAYARGPLASTAAARLAADTSPVQARPAHAASDAPLHRQGIEPEVTGSRAPQPHSVTSPAASGRDVGTSAPRLASAPAPAPAAMRPRVPSVPSEYLIPLEGGAQLDVGLQAFVDALDTKQSKWRPGRVVKHFPNPDTGKLEHVLVEFQDFGDCQWIPVQQGRLCAFDNAGAARDTPPKEHPYEAGQFIDVLDRFRDKETREHKTKWRMAEIMRVSPTAILINYVNWSHEFDEWINVAKDGYRIAPQGTNSDEETKLRVALAKQKDAEFVDALARLGFTVVFQERDGNCLFRAIAHQVFGDAERHMEVRLLLLSHMDRHRSMFEPMHTDGTDFDEYLRRMEEPMQWGGYPEQLAAEEVFDRPIEVYSSVEFEKSRRVEPMRTHFEGDLPAAVKSVTPIRLSYHGNSHYNTLLSPDVTLPLTVPTDDQPHLILAHRLQRQAAAGVMSGSELSRRKQLITSQLSACDMPLESSDSKVAEAQSDGKESVEPSPVLPDPAPAALPAGASAALVPSPPAIDAAGSSPRPPPPRAAVQPPPPDAAPTRSWWKRS